MGDDCRAKGVGADMRRVGKKWSGEWLDSPAFQGMDCGAVSSFWRMKEDRRCVNVGAEVFGLMGFSGWSSSDSGSESDSESSLGGGEGLLTCSAGAELDGCWGSRGVSAGRLEREREVLRARAGEASRAACFKLLGGADGVARELRGGLSFGRNFPPLSRGCWAFGGINYLPFERGAWT